MFVFPAHLMNALFPKSEFLVVMNASSVIKLAVSSCRLFSVGRLFSFLDKRNPKCFYGSDFLKLVISHRFVAQFSLNTTFALLLDLYK